MNYNPKYIYEWPRPAQMIVLGIVFAIVFYLGYVLTITPLITRLNLAKQQEEELKTQLTLLYKNHAEIKDDLVANSTLFDELTQWKAKLTKPADFPEVLNEILKLGTQSGLVFNTFSPDKESEADAYIKIPIKTTIVGTYDQIGTFVSQITNMDKLVVIESFTASKAAPESGADKTANDTAAVSTKLVADMILNVYEVKPT